VKGAVAAGTAFRSLRGGTDPFASSQSLGRETDAGVDWKLLEGMTLYFKYAFWQPGDWFDWAYQAAIPGGATGPLGKSAIQSIQGSFIMDF
jgi:hypothetical protein